jgi:hypothetical protein
MKHLYTIVEVPYSRWRPQREYGDKELFPAFDTLSDAIIFLEYTCEDATELDTENRYPVRNYTIEGSKEAK